MKDVLHQMSNRTTKPCFTKLCPFANTPVIAILKFFVSRSKLCSMILYDRFLRFEHY
jgi:hypothetical protein